MSSAGQIIGGVVGAVIGFFAGGNVMLGASIGMAIGGAIDPPKGPDIKGPRLSDLSQQTSTLGQIIPRVYGTTAIYGNVFWIENNALKETSKTESQGGKGGGGSETTTYAYSSTFALGLCKGQIFGIRRIWINNQMIYDQGSSDVGTLLVSAQTQSFFAFYNGSDTQNPDPRMQADLGVGQTSAYRGLAYLVFYDLPLEKYGNTLAAAQIKVEVVTDGAIETAEYQSSSPFASALSADTRTHTWDNGSSFNAYWIRKSTPRSGKYYIEYLIRPDSVSARGYYFGVIAQNEWLGPQNYPHNPYGEQTYLITNTNYYGASIGLVRNGSSEPNTLYDFTIGDIIGVAVNYDTKKVWISRNGVFYGEGNPEADDRPLFNLPSASFDPYGSVYPAVGAGVTYTVANLTWDQLVYKDDLPTFAPYQHSVLTPSDVTLASVVQSECLQSSLLTAGDIDVTGLADMVHGYRVATVAAIRSSVEPLQGAYPFDIVQSGYGIKFKRRGSTSSVATVPGQALSAKESAEGDAVRITNAREMDSQLPYRVRLTYLDAVREYDIAEQYSERLNTDSVNIRSIEMPLVLSPDEAAQMSEVLLYMYWLERNELSFKLSPDYLNLEPADVITINDVSATYSVRLTNINYLPSGILECSARYNNAATYTSTAVGETSPPPVATLSPEGFSNVRLLDLPTLLDSVDEPGFVVAMGGLNSGWHGGTLYRSVDSGQTYAAVNGFVDQCKIGSCGAALGMPSDSRMIDKAGKLSVTMTNGATLSSVTEAQMLNGLNHFAYGTDGRWEIIAAQNCALQGDGTYVLTDLLRGRFGSEWAMGLHASGDDIILLDSTLVQWSASNLNAIGSALLYKAVTQGRSLAQTPETTFSYRGNNLECLSPVYPLVRRVGADTVIDFIRRTRIGGEWRDYIDAPLGEASEMYEMVVFTDNTRTVEKRVISSTTQSFTYTKTQQDADFPITPAYFYSSIYQLSSNVGRGNPLNIDLVAKTLFSYAVLASHFEGTNGSTTFVDVKGNTLTANGNMQISTDQSKAGSSSAKGDGSGDYIAVTNTSLADVSTVDSMFECWVYITSFATNSIIYQTFTNTGSSAGHIFFIDTSGKLVLYAREYYVINSIGSVPLNTWTHLTCSITYADMVARLFINGVQVATGTFASVAGLQSTDRFYLLGDIYGGSLTGYADEFIFSKGFAYTSNFTPRSTPFEEV
ncbi:MAG: hypothetical protein IPM06_19090 [Rhizobiales bacterium]|nr:hypothetical protein [Hyphomicrobiales bacterium]